VRDGAGRKWAEVREKCRHDPSRCLTVSRRY
jgi:hypothetical protein